MGPHDVRAALGGYLFLLGVIYALPWTLAAEKWQHITEKDTYHTVIWAGTLTTFTITYLTGYFEKLFAQEKPSNSDHPDRDETPVSRIIMAWKAPYVINPMKATESIFDAATRFARSSHSYLVKDGATKAQYDAIFTASVLAVRMAQELRDNLRQATELCEQQAAQIKEFMDTGALTPIGRPNTDWENMIERIFPGIDDLTPISVQWRIEALKAKADYTPLFDMLGTTTARERSDITDSAGLRDFLINRFKQQMQPIYDMIPEEFKSPGESLLDNISAGILQLKNLTQRMTKRLSKAPMEVETPPAPMDTILSDVTNAIPTEYQPSQLNKESILAALWNWRSRQPQVAYKTPTAETLGCRHPTELRMELGEENTTTWERCLEIVRNLVRQPLPQESTLYAVEPTRCFRASDVPPLDDPDQYWTWRATFKRFATAEQVSDNALNTAIARVLGRFTGKAADLARPWQIQDLVLGNWPQTINRFLAYADMRLLDAEYFDNQIRKWRGMRPRPGQTGLEFLREFESQFLTINEVAQTMDRPELAQGEMIRQAIAVIPAGVRNLLQLQQQNPDLMSPKQFFDSTIIAWNFVQKEEKRSNYQSRPTASAREARPTPARATGSPFSLPCDKPCFDTAPALPNHLRGKIRNAQGQVIEHYRNLCFRCRRTEAEHGHQVQGCTRHGTHEYHQTSARSITAPPGGDPGTQ